MSEAASPARGRVPTAVSAVLLALLGAAVVAVALTHPAKATREADRTTPDAGAVPLGIDLLTGRPLDPTGRPTPPADGPGSPGRPLRLRFVPSADQARTLATTERLSRWLASRTGYEVESRVLGSYGLVIEELIQGRCDIAFLTAASYARARLATDRNDDPDDDIVAFLGAVRHGSEDHPGSELAYRAALLVRDDSPLRRVEDLRDGVRVAMGSPVSGASSILPSALFHRLGVEPRITRFGAGYPLIIEAVLQGAVDVGCIWWSVPNDDAPRNDARLTVLGAHPDVFETTRLIGFTEWIPNEPVVARASVPEDVRHVVARALCLYIATRVVTDEGRIELQAVGSQIGYLPATSADYDPLLDVIERAFADDPEGWADFRRER